MLGTVSRGLGRLELLGSRCRCTRLTLRISLGNLGRASGRATQLPRTGAGLLPSSTRLGLGLEVLPWEGFDGTWHYGTKDKYELHRAGDKLTFKENLAGGRKLTGTLSQNGDWYEGALLHRQQKTGSFIRLKRSDHRVLSNFKKSMDDSWGSDTMASRRTTVPERIGVGSAPSSARSLGSYSDDANDRKDKQSTTSILSALPSR